MQYVGMLSIASIELMHALLCTNLANAIIEPLAMCSHSPELMRDQVFNRLGMFLQGMYGQHRQ
jgi:hypothetical protein